MTTRELKEKRKEFRDKSLMLKNSSYSEVLRLKETDDVAERRIKELLKPNSYNELSRHYFGGEGELCQADCAPFHIKAYKELYHNQIINQFLHGFRGSAKSVHATIINPFALKQNDKLKFFLVVGSNTDQAVLLLSDLQMQLESNEKIIKDFGNQKVYGDWADGQFQTSDGCFFMALGFDKKFRGLRKYSNRIDHAVIDDCEDTDIAENPRLVAKRVKKVTGDIGNAFQKGKRRLVICNNHFVKKGLMDGLHERLDGKFTKTHTFNLTDGSAESPGKPSWPAYFSQQEVQNIHDLNDLNTLKREHYNTPVTEGKVIKPEWIKYGKLPNAAKPEIAFGFWDLSYARDGDFKAMPLLVVWKMKMYLVDAFCEKCEISRAISTHYDKAIYYKKKGWAVYWYYDATASQKEVFSPLFEAESIRRNFMEQPIPEHMPGVDKFLRMEATLVNAFFHGNIIIDERLKGDPHWEIGLAQLMALEKGSKEHDDFPDALENVVRKAQVYCVDRAEVSGANPVFIERQLEGF